MNAPYGRPDAVEGTYIFNLSQRARGYWLNTFLKSLDVQENRDWLAAEPRLYLDRYPMTSEQRQAVIERDWLGMLQLGGNIYYTLKLAIFDGLTVQHVGAAMSRPQMSVEEFRQMMLAGGRSPKERSHG